ncbi:FAD:protein FMN transferase [Agromyces rhizosphaerae]|uniref:FAD:protein FMN transferase n=1 Tax=Agromyces rhizosphaerae TaxID=88374 RepID=A0A9W6CWF5_9MICO|nr:FAD:protein FMN transferase [Agromyces rhizosphaerae]GLI28039.1 FAD:protein FMN transferase [Agromyces rhizosphaerae]
MRIGRNGRAAFPAMGTVVTVVLPGAVPADGHAPVLGRVVDAFAALEARFSLYRDDTDLARIRDGALRLTDADEVVRDAYALALRWRSATEGVFSPHRPDGVLDLDGVVKALAIEQAGDVLDDAGVADWCVDAGGDALVRGHGPGGGPWVAGIVDPGDRARVATTAVLDGARRAIATSGTAERGAHVWSTPGRRPLVQSSVVAPDIVTADVLATAVLAGGRAMLDLVQRDWDVDVFAVTDDDRVVRSAGWPSAPSHPLAALGSAPADRPDQATLTPSSAPIA